jgi:N-acetylmuramoyl-L-alanine amidase
MRVYRPSNNIVTRGYVSGHLAYDFAGLNVPDAVRAGKNGVIVERVDAYNSNWSSTPPLTTRDYGNYIKIKHDDGTFELHAHLRQGSSFVVGTRVTAGQTVARIGNTGNSTGPHLHSEYRNASNQNVPAEFYFDNQSKTICLSAGHGAGDPGASHQTLQEATLTEIIVKRAAEMIRKHSVDCLEVPSNLTLIETIQWINNRTDQITICVEAHINSGGGTGVEGWNYEGGPNESDKLSKFLADASAAETGLPNRGVKDETLNRYRKLGFVHDTNPIAALLECAFIDGDYEYLKKDENLTKSAKGLARGCLSYIGVTWKPELVNPPTPAPSPTPTPSPTPPSEWQQKYLAEVEARRKDAEDFAAVKKQKDEEIAKLTDRLKKIKDFTATT